MANINDRFITSRLFPSSYSTLWYSLDLLSLLVKWYKIRRYNSWFENEACEREKMPNEVDYYLMYSHIIILIITLLTIEWVIREDVIIAFYSGRKCSFNSQAAQNEG